MFLYSVLSPWGFVVIRWLLWGKTFWEIVKKVRTILSQLCEICCQIPRCNYFTLREKCRYLEFFWSAFSRFPTEYAVLGRYPVGKTYSKIQVNNKDTRVTYKHANLFVVDFAHVFSRKISIWRGIYLFKVNYENTRAMCGICSNLTKRHENNVSNVVLVFLFSFLNISHMRLTLKDPFISESCIEIIELNFYFHTSLWCLKEVWK